MAVALALGSRVPDSFLRFCCGAAAVAAAIACALEASPARWAWLALAMMGSVELVMLRRQRESRALLWSVLLAAVAAPGAAALLSGSQPLGLAAAGALSSALLLGAVTVTMILGHWYLVDTSLSITPLRSGARWLWAGVLARWTVVGLALALGGWEVLHVTRAADLIFSSNGLFFLFRSLMGLVAPLLLTGLIWQTVKMRSTQSATGLLYVALILVLFGELVSHFLQIATGLPL